MTDEPKHPDPVGPERLDDNVQGGGADDTTSEQPTVGEPSPSDDIPADDVPSDDIPADDIPADDIPADDGGAGSGDDGRGWAAPPPPPPPAAPQVVPRLVRDPYSRLGGVASGIAHHYGLDVSIVRLLVVLFALATGFGFIAYLLAWLIIPRADYWPPPGPARPLRSLGGRDLGLALAIIGLVLVFVVGVGDGGVLVPLALVGGGVWLLIQNPQAPPPGTEPVVTQPAADQPVQPGPAPAAAAYVATPSQPVQRRSRRRGLLAVLLVIIGLVILLPLVAAGAFVTAVASGEIDLEGPRVIHQRPGSADDFPLTITEDGGEVTIDLGELDSGDFDDLDDPAQLKVDLDYGEVRVIVPSDLDVAVDAEAAAGDVEIFGRHSDGIRPDVRLDEHDPDIEMNLDIGFGQIRVERE